MTNKNRSKLTEDDIQKQLAFEEEIAKDINRRDREKLIRINDQIHRRLNALRQKETAELARLDRDFDANEMPITEKRFKKAIDGVKDRMRSFTGRNYHINKHSLARLMRNFVNRQDLSNSFLNAAMKNRNKAFKQVTTATYRSTSFTGNRTGEDSISALETELLHILRLLNDDTYKEELVENNLVEFKGQHYNISDIKVRRKLNNDIMAEVQVIRDEFSNEKSKKTRLANKIDKARKKIRDKNKNLTKMTEEITDQALAKDLSDFLNKFKDLDTEATENDYTATQELQDRLFNYYNQAMQGAVNKSGVPLTTNQITNSAKRKSKTPLLYLDDINEAIQSIYERDNANNLVKKANTPLFKEFLFKLPHHAGEFDITAQEYMDATKAYFQKHFPEYEVLVSVVHFDETKEPDKRTGDHIHLIMKTKNTVTGKYDLAEKYRQHGINTAVKLGLIPLPDKTSLSPIELVRSGQALGFDFLINMQRNLFDSKDICLSVLSNEEKLDFHNLVMSVEQDLPQDKRTFNSIQMDHETAKKYKQQLELTEQKLIAAKRTISSAVKNTEKIIIKKYKEVEDKCIEQSFTKFSDLIENSELNNGDAKNHSSQIFSTSIELKSAFDQALDNICNQYSELTEVKTRFKKEEQKIKDRLNKIKIEKSEVEQEKGILNKLTKMLGGKENTIKSLMHKVDQLIDRQQEISAEKEPFQNQYQCAVNLIAGYISIYGLQSKNDKDARELKQEVKQHVGEDIFADIAQSEGNMPEAFEELFSVLIEEKNHQTKIETERLQARTQAKQESKNTLKHSLKSEFYSVAQTPKSNTFPKPTSRNKKI